MKIDIEHEEVRKGLVFKKTYHMVKCRVQYSEEERAIIDKADIEDVIVMERPPSAELDPRPDDDPAWYFLRIGHFIKGGWNEYCTLSPSDAKIYEQELIGSLKELKEYIQQNAGIEETTTSFEL